MLLQSVCVLLITLVSKGVVVADVVSVVDSVIVLICYNLRLLILLV